MLLQLLGSKNGCNGAMPESGLYAGQTEKYYFHWVVRAAAPAANDGKVSINASRLDVPDVKNLFCDDVSYWQGPEPMNTMDLDRDNEGLISLSNKLGINPREWWGFSHDFFWIEAFGVRLELVG
ncbi:hypothetical protein FOL47_002219 [Perkinsus chesapeaki]|uniref:Uncharacterized protein n=1 Tax=Perkinsus chesapeaki TaxID=330153 RepID=A0A7J6MGJ9_PERCH|nr:hypothetical protein FOL47_002219 [Perkinsus chesapeaki]